MTDTTTFHIPIEQLIEDTERTAWECEQLLLIAKAHEANERNNLAVILSAFTE